MAADLPPAFPRQTALLLVVAVVPTLHIVRAGIDENVAFLLLSVGIVLSEDRTEVVQIVTFYAWLLEGSSGPFGACSNLSCVKKKLTLISFSLLPVCLDLVLFGQPPHAHEVHDSSQVKTVATPHGRPLVAD